MKRIVALIVCLLAGAYAANATFAIFQTARSGVATCTTDGSDGFAGAPSGAAPLSTLLNGYSLRAPWCVVGVDYNVGYASVPTKTPGVTAPPAGMACVGATHICTVSSNSVVVDGWDFSIGGGWQLAITGNAAVVQNNKFVVGSNGLQPLNTGSAAVSGLTLQNNIIDGAGLNLSVAQVSVIVSGDFVAQYNWIKNAFSVVLQAIPSGASTLSVKYNILQNPGMGALCCAQHGDWLQSFGNGSVNGTYSSHVTSYNLLITNDANAAGQGLSILSAAGNVQTSVASVVANNNTAVITQAAAGGIANGLGIIDTTWLNGSGTLQNNYVDCTACFPSSTSWAFVGQYNGCGQGATNAATAAGNNTLHFSNVNTLSLFGSCGSINTTNPVSGGVLTFNASLLWNLTTPTSIPAPTNSSGTYSASTTSTTIVMNVNAAGAGVGNGDVIRSGDGPYSGTVSCGTSNKNMLTGGTFTLPAC